jgi:flagellar basal-body rod modification protein FlgD
MVAPLISAVAAGLSAVSALKSLTDGSKTNSTDTSAASTSTQSSSASNSGTASASELQDRFLKLLVAQMKNQDPLNPLDNAQVTTQLAQISTVSGIDKLNTTLSGLSTSMLAAQSAQSASLIGRQVYAAGSTLTLSGTTGTANGALDLKQAADRVTVMIADANGTVVRQLELGPSAVGTTMFQWDGKTSAGTKAPAGNYVFQVSAAKGTTSVAAEPLSIGKVSGVTVADGMKLSLDGGGSVGLNDVKRIF